MLRHPGKRKRLATGGGGGCAAPGPMVVPAAPLATGVVHLVTTEEKASATEGMTEGAMARMMADHQLKANGRLRFGRDGEGKRYLMVEVAEEFMFSSPSVEYLMNNSDSLEAEIFGLPAPNLM